MNHEENSPFSCPQDLNGSRTPKTSSWFQTHWIPKNKTSHYGHYHERGGGGVIDELNYFNIRAMSSKVERLRKYVELLKYS